MSEPSIHAGWREILWNIQCHYKHHLAPFRWEYSKK